MTTSTTTSGSKQVLVPEGELDHEQLGRGTGDTVLFMDFDAAYAESDHDRGQDFSVVYGGVTLTGNTLVASGPMLRYMRNGASTESIPQLLELMLGKEQYLIVEGMDEPFEKLVLLLNWLAEQLGDRVGRSGN